MGMTMWWGMLGAMVVVTAGPVSGQTAYTVVPAAAIQQRSQPESATTKSTASQTKVSLSVQDSTLQYVIHALAHQAHLSLVFTGGPLYAQKLSVHIVNMDVMDAFAAVLKGKGVVARLVPDEGTIVISAASQGSRTSTTQGGREIMGRVTDSASNAGLSGAAVKVIGTNLATLTSDSGTFVLRDVPAGKQVVTARLFGYKPGERAVTVADSQRTMVRIILTPNATVLSGVVTTATGIQSRLSVGNDITVLNVDSIMQTAPITSVTDLLANRVPGLTVVHTTGTPGDPSRLLLRGAASLEESNNPIIVVDGVRVYYPDSLSTNLSQGNGTNASFSLSSVSGSIARPSPLDQIDPNTIQTIEVFKGPSAAALYGSDAANGVIVITTKKGQPGATHWSVSANQGVSYIPGAYPTYTYVFGHSLTGQSGQCIGKAFIGNVGSAANGICVTTDSVRTFQALNDPNYTVLTHGPFTRASATVSGGVSGFTYSLTGGISQTNGTTKLPKIVAQVYDSLAGTPPLAWMMHPDAYITTNGSGQVTTQLSSKASVTISNALTSSTQHRTSLDNLGINLMEGKYFGPGNVPLFTTTNNIFTKITQNTQTSLYSGTLQWQVRPWLPLTLTAGYNTNGALDQEYLPNGVIPASLIYTFSDSGFFESATNTANIKTLNVNTTLPVPLSHGASVSLAVGTNFVAQSTRGTDQYTSYVPVGVTQPTTFLGDGSGSSQSSQNSATYGWFVEPQLHMPHNIFVTPGIRLDGGTSSGSNAGLSAFPKMNASYVILDNSESAPSTLWQNLLTLVRLRGSFGIAGVQPAPGQSLRLFMPDVISLDGGASASSDVELTGVGNTFLRPEKSREWEGGLDAELWQNRVSVTATFYNKLRIDAIEPNTIAPSVGATGSNTQYLNIGNVRNVGEELSATAQILQTPGLQWSLNGSISTNFNKMLSISNNLLVQGVNSCAPPTSGTPTGGLCLHVGYPINGYWGSTLVGYSDANGDGFIERNDLRFADSLHYYGSADPRYTASFGTDLALWHGLMSFHVNGNYVSGLTLLNGNTPTQLETAAYTQSGTSAGLLAEALAAAENASGYGRLYNTFQTISELRIDGLSLNVVLPSGVARAFRSHLATLSLQGSNLYLRTNYAGKDPDVNAFSSGLGVADLGIVPQPRTWSIAMRVTQ